MRQIGTDVFGEGEEGICRFTNLAGGLRADDDEIIQRSIERLDGCQQLMLEDYDLGSKWGLLKINKC